MARQYDLDAHILYPGHGRIEVSDLEPQQDPIAIRLVIGVADLAMFMLDVESVQLEDERTVGHQPLLCAAAMRAFAAEEPLIPPAAGLDVADGNERLRAHPAYISARILKVNVRHIRFPPDHR